MVVVEGDAFEHAERIVREHGDRAVERSRYDAAPRWLIPMRRIERLGLTSPGRPGWKRPTTPRFRSPVRIRRMSVLLVL